MRAAEFITELGNSVIGAGLQAQQAAGLARRQAASARIAQQAQAQAQAAVPVPTPAPTAPTASSKPAPRPATPAAAAPAPTPPPANTQAQARLAALGQTPAPAPKAPGIMGQTVSAIGKGVKAGLGMNPEQGFMRGLAGKALNAMNMGATANGTLPTNPTLTPAQQAQFKVGDTVDHPKLGKLTIKTVEPHGVTFDASHTTVGSDFIMSAPQMQQARIGIFKP